MHSQGALTSILQIIADKIAQRSDEWTRPHFVYIITKIVD